MGQNAAKSIGSISKMESDLVQSVVETVVSGGPGSNEYTMSILKLVIQMLHNMTSFAQPLMKMDPTKHKCTSDCAFCPIVKLFKYLDTGSSDQITMVNTQKALTRVFADGNDIEFPICENPKDGFEVLIEKVIQNVNIKTFNFKIEEGWVCGMGKCRLVEEGKKKYVKRCITVDGKKLLKKIEENRKVDIDKRFNMEELMRMVRLKTKTCPKCRTKNSYIRTPKVVKSPYVVPIYFDWSSEEIFTRWSRKEEKVRNRLYQFLKILAPKIKLEEFLHFHKNVKLTGKCVGILADCQKMVVAYYYVPDSEVWYFASHNDAKPIGGFGDVVKDMLDVEAWPSLVFFEVRKR